MTLRIKTAEMHEEINKPIFVVGSPRSGTSILAWCLGYHPNIFAVPESNWMGDFAVNVAMSYQVGAARGILSILSAMGISRDEFFSHIGRSINSLVLKHRGDLDRQRLIVAVQRLLKERGLYLGEVTGEFDAATSAAVQQYEMVDKTLYSELVDSLRTAASDSECKTRWVDQTPQYSFHICGLRKLFPDALFIHIVRDVTSVVRSMLNFHRIAGTHLVANEEEAYKYWLRTVNACLKAEEAYGPHVVYRLRYTALVENPESAVRSLLDFLGEPYSAKCLEALSERINSSNVPPDFKSDDPATDPAIVEEARRLSAEIEQTSQPTEGSVAVADQLEAALSGQIAKVEHYAAEIEQYKLQLARQEQHYTAEIDEYKLQLARQEHHYTAEVEQYKSKVASQERHYAAQIEEHKSQLGRQEHHYTAEIEEYKTQLARQEHHYTAEIEEYKTQLAKQEHHYTAEVEQYKSQVASQERHYTGEIEVYKSQIARLYKQLQDARKLSRLLDNVENVAKQLNNSRRWKLANVGAVIKAKLSRGKVSTGYDPLDKIVAAYSRWRASHPEIGKLDEEISALESQTVPEIPAIEPEKESQSSSHPGDGSSETAVAAKTSGTSPPFA